jgi:hypothetical protein
MAAFRTVSGIIEDVIAAESPETLVTGYDQRIQTCYNDVFVLMLCD